MPEDGETIIGMRNICGKNYLFIDAGSDNWVSIIAYPVQTLVTEAALFFLATITTYLLIVMITGSVLRKSCTVESSGCMSNEKAYSDFITEKKKNISIVLSLLSIAIFVILLVGNLFACGMSFVEFSSCWEKGFNVITLSYVLLTAAICFGMILLINLVNSVPGRILTPKGSTISALTATLVKVILLSTFLVASLEQFGVNTIAIASSLGLAGLSLSIGSKNMVSDLMAGLCIAFEGQLQLGDYVQINGFTGEIVSLGIRTTKLKKANQELIVNNTNMKNALNYSRGRNMFAVTVILTFETDTDALKRMVDEAQQRFTEACNGKMQGGLNFAGVSEFTAVGMKCLFLGLASPSNASSCSRCCNTVLIKVLREHGITPFSVRK